MDLDTARANIGRKVVYRAHGVASAPAEEGVITGVNSRYVFVRYGADYGSKATSPELLGLFDPGSLRLAPASALAEELGDQP